MAKERSDTSGYPSRFGGGHVTAAQYITEYLCENIARSKKKELPTRFWENEEWAKFFRTQIVMLNKHLIHKYEPKAIIRSLRDWRCKWVSSFGGFLKVKDWMKVLQEYDAICKRENDLLEKELVKPLAEVPDATKQKPATAPGRQSIFNKLREIEHGKES